MSNCMNSVYRIHVESKVEGLNSIMFVPQNDSAIQWLSTTSSNTNESTNSSTAMRDWNTDVVTYDNETSTVNAQDVDAWAMSILRQWATEANLENVDELERLNDDRLTSLLTLFISEVKRPDGGAYGSAELFSIIAGVQSHLTSKRGEAITEPFVAIQKLVHSQARSVNHGVRLPVRRYGLASLTPDQEDVLWQCGALGDYNPTVLLHTLVYLNSRNFSIGCGHHHRRIRYRTNPQITLHEPVDAPAYLQYLADGQGASHAKVIYANPLLESRCHVSIYRKYCDKSPHEDRDPLAFYIAPKRTYHEAVWFSRVPIGHNGLQTIVPDLCKRAQCENAVMDAGIQLSSNEPQLPSLGPSTNT